MAQELYNTSAARGLRPGSTGFCTVATTAGMTGPMIQRLESLGGYRPIFDVGHPQADQNPPVYAHWRFNIGGHYYSSLSYVGYAGADDQGRFNKLAYHLVVDVDDQVPAGPAWVMMQPGVIEKKWEGEPRILPVGKQVPSGPNPLQVCRHWEEMAGDAGLAGMLAQAFILDATKPAYILYEPGMELLPLLNEALTLLPENRRWRVTFNTYFESLPAGLLCNWRCCPVGTPAGQMAPSNATSGVLIDLTRPPQRAPDNLYTIMARTGAAAEPAAVGETPKIKRFDNNSGETRDNGLSLPVSSKVASDESLKPVSASGEVDTGYQSSIQHPHGSTSRSYRKLALTLGWPLVVLAIGVALLWTKGPFGAGFGGSRTEGIVPDVERLKTELEQSRRLNTEMEAYLAQAKEDLKESKSQVASLESKLEQANAEAEKAKTRIASLTDELERRPLPTVPTADTTKIATTTTTPPPVASTTDHTTSPIPPAVPDGILVMKWEKLKMKTLGGIPTADTNATRLETACNFSGAARARLVLPVAPEEIPSAFAANPDAAVVSYRMSKSNLSGKVEEAPLGSIAIENGKLLWAWKEVTLGEAGSNSLDELAAILRHATVRVEDSQGTRLAIYQLGAPQNVKVKMADGNARQKLTCPWVVTKGGKIDIIGEGWDLDGEPENGRFKGPTGLQLRVSLAQGKENMADLVVEWVEGSSPDELNKRKSDAENRIASLVVSLEEATKLEKKLRENLLAERGRHEADKKKNAEKQREATTKRENASKALAQLKSQTGLDEKVKRSDDLFADLPKVKGKREIDVTKANTKEYRGKWREYQQVSEDIASIRKDNPQIEELEKKISQLKGELDNLGSQQRWSKESVDSANKAANDATEDMKKQRQWLKEARDDAETLKAMMAEAKKLDLDIEVRSALSDAVLAEGKICYDQ